MKEYPKKFLRIFGTMNFRDPDLSEGGNNKIFRHNLLKCNDTYFNKSNNCKSSRSKKRRKLRFYTSYHPNCLYKNIKTLVWSMDKIRRPLYTKNPDYSTVFTQKNVTSGSPTRSTFCESRNDKPLHFSIADSNFEEMFGQSSNKYTNPQFNEGEIDEISIDKSKYFDIGKLINNVCIHNENKNCVEELKRNASKGNCSSCVIFEDEYIYKVFYVKGKVFSVLEFCSICSLWQSSSISHCNQCGRCVESASHHSYIFMNCIAKRNYRYYASFLFTLAVLFSWVTCITCFSFIKSLTMKEHWHEPHNKFIHIPLIMSNLVNLFIVIYLIGKFIFGKSENTKAKKIMLLDAENGSLRQLYLQNCVVDLDDLPTIKKIFRCIEIFFLRVFNKRHIRQV